MEDANPGGVEAGWGRLLAGVGAAGLGWVAAVSCSDRIPVGLPDTQEAHRPGVRHKLAGASATARRAPSTRRTGRGWRTPLHRRRRCPAPRRGHRPLSPIRHPGRGTAVVSDSGGSGSLRRPSRVTEPISMERVEAATRLAVMTKASANHEEAAGIVRPVVVGGGRSTCRDAARGVRDTTPGQGPAHRCQQGRHQPDHLLRHTERPMPCRRPSALRTQQLGRPRRWDKPPPERIHCLSARNSIAIHRVEQLGSSFLYPGAIDQALRRYEAFLGAPGRRPLYPQDEECGSKRSLRTCHLGPVLS